MVLEIQRSSANLKSDDLIEAINKAIAVTELQRRQRRILGGKLDAGMLQLRVPEKLVLIGDIHGDLRTLFEILDLIKFGEFLTNPNNKIIFLGDYVDRGRDSIGVLFTICYLKQKYPDSIVLMRGNHEAPIEFPFSSHDLPYRLLQHYGEHVGKMIYQKKILKFFSLLTLATVVENRLLLIHGGLPTRDIQLTTDFRKLIATAEDTHIHNSVMEEILWNDPLISASGNKDWDYSKRGFGRLFGPNVTKKWLIMSETRVVVRGHQPCQGFKIDHDGMVMTLFSCKEPYPKFRAGHLVISAPQLLSMRTGMELSRYVS